MQNTAAARNGIDEGLRAHMTGTYAILAKGLLLTAAAAWATMETPLHLWLTGPEGLTGLGWVVMLSPLALILAASFGMVTGGASASLVYWAFVLLQGPGLGLFASGYEAGSVANAAAATAATFGAASLYGYTTGRNLDSLGAFMFMGLIGLIAAGIVNLFLGSAAVDFATSVIAVVVFTGLAAWDTQRLKDAYVPGLEGKEGAWTRYIAALSLYVSVLNLFLSILSLAGQKK